MGFKPLKQETNVIDPASFVHTLSNKNKTFERLFPRAHYSLSQNASEIDVNSAKD